MTIRFSLVTLIGLLYVITFIQTSSLQPIPRYEVKMLLFSGTEDPSFFIGPSEYYALQQILSNKKFKYKKSTRVLGYSGFSIHQDGTNTYTSLSGNPEAELFILYHIKNKIQKNIYDYVEKCIGNYKKLTGNSRTIPRYKMSMIQTENKSTLMPVNSNSINCNKTPIRGPDFAPQFSSSSSTKYCFESRQRENNCYNYSNNIVTNSFAQPGRGSSWKYRKSTCESLISAAKRDGLKFVGKQYPSNRPRKGHHIALFVWPGENFHFIRQDANGLWSHKPGVKCITNADNDGNLITDPSRQDFSPYTEFCGYLYTGPSKVRIN